MSNAALKIPPVVGLASTSPSSAAGGIVAVCKCGNEFDEDDWCWAAMGPHGWEYEDGFWKVSSRTCPCGTEARRCIGVSSYTLGLRTSDVARLAAQARARMLTDEAAAEFDPSRWDVAADSADESEAMWRALVDKCDGDDERARRLRAMVDL